MTRSRRRLSALSAAALGAAALGAAWLVAPGTGVSPAAAATTTGPVVSSFGDAAQYGTVSPGLFSSPVTGLARSRDGQGYWLVTTDGGVFSFGDAGFHGSLGGTRLAAPVVGMAATPDGGGYWLVAADGGVFSFGDAGFHGSAGGTRLVAPVVGMAATPAGGGYWLVAADGGVFTYGDAHFEGSLGSQAQAYPVAGMASTPSGGGYWVTTTARAAPAATCQPGQLAVAYDQAHSSGGAAGSLGLTYRLTNTSRVTCSLDGYAGLQMLDVQNRPIPTHVGRSTTQGGPETVTLAPGGQAWFAIEFPTQTGYGNLYCPTSSSLAVIPPNDYGQLVVSGPGGQLQPYGGTQQNLRCGQISETPVLPQPPF